MNGDWTCEPGPRERPLGVALRTRERPAAGQRREPGAKKFVGISLEVASARVASCLEAEDVEGSGTGWFWTPGPEISCPKSLTLFSLYL